tara:strand:- start:448 stop:648 length:201 start_codon:yes stop_codon:yes gene_type:complete
MIKTTTGLNTTLYTFPFHEEYSFIHYYRELSKVGQVTEVFIDNKLAFEYTPNKERHAPDIDLINGY